MVVPTETEPVRVVCGDALEFLAGLPAEFVQCCVTSPPYWGGLRDYGRPGQIGLEREPADYIGSLLEVFGQVRRALRPDGCLWLNLGDVYAASGKGGGGSAGQRGSWDTVRDRKGFRMPPPGYKMKDLTLVPFQVADALRRAGWYLRATAVWRKPTATEPHRLDRPAVSHEYLFLLAKSEAYQCRNPGAAWWGASVWDISPDICDGHPATMPEELVVRCLSASTRAGDVVLDPFMGSGTTAAVAVGLGRRVVGCELNPDYLPLIRRRVATVTPDMFANVGEG